MGWYYLRVTCDGRVMFCCKDGPSQVTLRWQSDGAVVGDGREVRWTPAGDDDQLSVAVRSKGGVAVTSLRAADLER